MAMVGVDSGILYRRTHSLSHLAWSWVGGHLAPFYIHQMNRVNYDNTINIVLELLQNTKRWIHILELCLRSEHHRTTSYYHHCLGVYVQIGQDTCGNILI